MTRSVVRYSEAFKLKVVNELESGKFSGTDEARKSYGIKDPATVIFPFSTINHQPSTFHFQFSTILPSLTHFQLSIFNFPLFTIHCSGFTICSLPMLMLYITFLAT